MVHLCSSFFYPNPKASQKMTSFHSWVKLLKMINYKKFNRYFSLIFVRYILGRFYTIRKIYKILNKILFTSKVHPDLNDYIIFNSSQNELLNDLTVSGVSKKLFLKKEFKGHLFYVAFFFIKLL